MLNSAPACGSTDGLGQLQVDSLYFRITQQYIQAYAITSVLAYYLRPWGLVSRPNNGRPQASWMKMDLIIARFF